jgi:hypothetical protein
MKKNLEDARILILDDEGTDGCLFNHCYRYSEKSKRENITVVKTLNEFLERVRSYDLRFVDFGELGYDGCMRFAAEGVDVIIEYLEENPSIDVWFVLTMPWNYYECFRELWQLPNAHHIQLEDHRDKWEGLYVP